MDFFGELIEKVKQRGFAPLAPLQKSKSTYTLHNLIRDQLGMAEFQEVELKSDVLPSTASTKNVEIHVKSDMADTSFWDFRTLRSFLNQIHQIMDTELSRENGRKMSAIAWAHQKERTVEEILAFLQRLRTKHPDLEVPQKANKRPHAKEMIQVRRVEAAIANTLAVLVANGSEYGDLLDQCADLELSNEDLLGHLDKIVAESKVQRESVDKKSEVPKALVHAYTKYRDSSIREDQRSQTLCDFLRAISTTNNFSGNSDESIVDRLRNSVKR